MRNFFYVLQPFYWAFKQENIRCKRNKQWFIFFNLTALITYRLYTKRHQKLLLKEEHFAKVCFRKNVFDFLTYHYGVSIVIVRLNYYLKECDFVRKDIWNRKWSKIVQFLVSRNILKHVQKNFFCVSNNFLSINWSKNFQFFKK